MVLHDEKGLEKQEASGNDDKERKIMPLKVAWFSINHFLEER
jgi:hypothetical protein